MVDGFSWECERCGLQAFMPLHVDDDDTAGLEEVLQQMKEQKEEHQPECTGPGEDASGNHGD